MIYPFFTFCYQVIFLSQGYSAEERNIINVHKWTVMSGIIQCYTALLKVTKDNVDERIPAANFQR